MSCIPEAGDGAEETTAGKVRHWVTAQPLQCWEPSSTASQEPALDHPPSPLLHLLLLLSPIPRLRQGSGLPLEQTQPSKKAISHLEMPSGLKPTAQAVLCPRCGSYRHTSDAFCLFLPFTKHPKTLLCHQRSSLTQLSGTQGVEQAQEAAPCSSLCAVSMPHTQPGALPATHCTQRSPQAKPQHEHSRAQALSSQPGSQHAGFYNFPASGNFPARCRRSYQHSQITRQFPFATVIAQRDQNLN